MLCTDEVTGIFHIVFHRSYGKSPWNRKSAVLILSMSCDFLPFFGCLGSGENSPNEEQLTKILEIGVPSLKLTEPLKIDPWKRTCLLKTAIFRGELLVLGRVIFQDLYQRSQVFVGFLMIRKRHRV